MDDMPVSQFLNGPSSSEFNKLRCQSTNKTSSGWEENNPEIY